MDLMKNAVPHSSEAGFTMMIAIVLCVVFTIIGAVVGSLVAQNSRKMQFFEDYQRTRGLAVTGQNTMIGKLILTPNMANSETTPYLDPESTVSGEGTISNWVIRRSTPMSNAFYIVTTAKRKGIEFKLHSYVTISNTADYLAAISDSLTVADGTDASSGMVYAPDLTFLTDLPTLRTRLRRAEYVKTCTPLPVNPQDILITENGGQPKQITPLTFPQLLPSDMDRYLELAHFSDPDETKHLDAGTANGKCIFIGAVFPPGYTNYSGAVTDNYSKHTTSNADHVYYCPDGMELKNVTVYGQVLFVSSNSITITGELLKGTGVLPGAGDISSSTAHQAVLITRQNVIISTGYYTTWTNTDPIKTQRIQAMIYAPHGTFIATSYDDPDPYRWDTTSNMWLGTSYNDIHSNLRLRFKGGMTLLTSPQLSIVFQGPTDPPPNPFVPSRTYVYDNDLANFPPPYLPAVAEVRYSFEEIANTKFLMNGIRSGVAN